jgi:AcrR family transcriptional regulator
VVPDSRAVILAAARRQLAAEGGSALRVDAVAGAAGVNKRMIYHWFRDREGLITAAFDAHAAGEDPVDTARLLAWQALEGRLTDSRLPAGLESPAREPSARERERAARSLALRLAIVLFGPWLERAFALEGQPWSRDLVQGVQTPPATDATLRASRSPPKPRVRLAPALRPGGGQTRSPSSTEK